MPMTDWPCGASRFVCDNCKAAGRVPLVAVDLFWMLYVFCDERCLVAYDVQDEMSYEAFVENRKNRS